MGERQPSRKSLITWDRARGIFGNAEVPAHVWECQFDGFDDALERMARTPQQEIDPSDLWYYHHDLTYVQLQPELFNYLFPVCLMDWHHTLMRNESCSHGDSDFHSGLIRGEVLHTMIGESQRNAVWHFLRDSFIERLDGERGYVDAASRTPMYGWLRRLNSLGLVTPDLGMFWNPWWAMETVGRAVAAVEYCSILIYGPENHPLFSPRTPEKGGGPPCLWDHDTLWYDHGWRSDNVAFLANVLTVDFVRERLFHAASHLRGEPELQQTLLIAKDADANQELIELRIIELIEQLRKPCLERRFDWSV